MNQILKNNYKFIKKTVFTGTYSTYAGLFFSSFTIEYLNKTCVSLPINIGPAIQVSKGI